jgi:hypothetical protein
MLWDASLHPRGLRRVARRLGESKNKTKTGLAMTEETTPFAILFLQAFGESLSVVDDFGCSNYRNHLPRWVYLLILIGMTYASL